MIRFAVKTKRWEKICSKFYQGIDGETTHLGLSLAKVSRLVVLIYIGILRC